MSEKYLPELGSGVADGLEHYLSEFLAALAAAGYAENTQHDRRRFIVSFIGWVRGARLAVADVDELCVGKFLARPSRRRFKRGNPERAAVHQFIEHLRVVGVTPRRRPPELSSAEVLVSRYIDHLRADRGLCERSIEVYSPFVRRFVATQRLPERGASLDASVVRAYLLVVRGKGRLHEHLPLLEEVGEALASYLRDRRSPR